MPGRLFFSWKEGVAGGRSAPPSASDFQELASAISAACCAALDAFPPRVCRRGYGGFHRLDRDRLNPPVRCL